MYSAYQGACVKPRSPATWLSARHTDDMCRTTKWMNTSWRCKRCIGNSWLGLDVNATPWCAANHGPIHQGYWKHTIRPLWSRNGTLCFLSPSNHLCSSFCVPSFNDIEPDLQVSAAGKNTLRWRAMRLLDSGCWTVPMAPNTTPNMFYSPSYCPVEINCADLAVWAVGDPYRGTDHCMFCFRHTWCYYSTFDILDIDASDHFYCCLFCLFSFCHLLQGFDEFMNLVLDNAAEVNVKKGTRKSVGKCFWSSSYFFFFFFFACASGWMNP